MESNLLYLWIVSVQITEISIALHSPCNIIKQKHVSDISVKKVTHWKNLKENVCQAQEQNILDVQLFHMLDDKKVWRDRFPWLISLCYTFHIAERIDIL